MGSLIHLGNPECFVENTLNTSMRKAQQKIDASTSNGTFFQVFQSQINAAAASSNDQQTTSFENLCKAAFEQNFGHSATTTYYHVMDAASIPREHWCHEDFPYDKFFANEADTSIVNWRPSRANPSQLASEIQSKVTSTLGKYAIVVPPALDEKMKTDPALRKKVARNIHYPRRAPNSCLSCRRRPNARASRHETLRHKALQRGSSFGRKRRSGQLPRIGRRKHNRPR